MSDERHELIRYTGKWPVKTDTIIPGCGRVWIGPSADHIKPPANARNAYRVPAKDVEKYLAFDGEFERVTPLYLCSPAAEQLSEDEQIWALQQIIGNLAPHACEELQVALTARTAELADLGRVQASPEDRARFRERHAKIADAIAQMDPLDNTHYTDLGRPRVTIVRRLTELDDVTAEEIAEVVRQTKG